MRIFISNRDVDADFARQLAEFLKQKGHNVWSPSDMEKEGTKAIPEEDRERRIDIELDGADLVVAVYADISYGNPLLNQWEGALLYQKPFCFVVRSEVQPKLYRYVGVRQIISPIGREHLGFEELIELIKDEKLFQDHRRFTDTLFPTIARQGQINDQEAKSSLEKGTHDKLIAHTWMNWISQLERDEVDSTRVSLGLELKPDALLLNEQYMDAGRQLSIDHDVFQVFNETASITDLDEHAQHTTNAEYSSKKKTHRRELLILGDPGSGKTYMLLHLARRLLASARVDSNQPVPLIFRLATWDGNKSIRDWLVKQLVDEHNMPQSDAESCIQKGSVLPLFDGLDEVLPRLRESCVEAINRFKRTYPLSGLVLSSRSQDYAALTSRLDVKAAIVIQPLSEGQAEDYLLENTTWVGSFFLHKSDKTVRSLSASPFVLTTLVEAYDNATWEQLVGPSDVNGRLAHIFSKWVTHRYKAQSSRKAKKTEDSSGKTNIGSLLRNRSQKDRAEPPYSLDELNRYLTVIAKHVAHDPSLQFNTQTSLTSDFILSLRNRLVFYSFASLVISTTAAFAMLGIDTLVRIVINHPMPAFGLRLATTIAVIIVATLLAFMLSTKWIPRLLSAIRQRFQSQPEIVKMLSDMMSRMQNLTPDDMTRMYDEIFLSRASDRQWQDQSLYLGSRLLAGIGCLVSLRIIDNPIITISLGSFCLLTSIAFFRPQSWRFWAAIAFLIGLWIGFWFTTPIIGISSVIIALLVQLTNRNTSMLKPDFSTANFDKALPIQGLGTSFLQYATLFFIGAIPSFIGPAPSLVSLIPKQFRATKLGETTLRGFIAFERTLPFDVERFLSFCAEIGLIRRISKHTYIFTHRFLLEYYAHPSYFDEAQNEYESRIRGFLALDPIRQVVQQLTTKLIQQNRQMVDPSMPDTSAVTKYRRDLAFVALRLPFRVIERIAQPILTMAARLQKKSDATEGVAPSMARMFRRKLYTLETRVFPKYSYAYYLLADTYNEEQRYEEACNVYTRLINIEPHSGLGYRWRAQTRLMMDNSLEAESDLISALSYEPDDALTHFSLGNIQYKRKDYLRAYESYRKAVGLASIMQYYQFQCGLLGYALGQLDVALYHFDQAVEYSENNIQVINRAWRAYVLQELGEHSLAVDEFDALLSSVDSEQNASDASWLLYNRALAKAQQGNYEAALTDLDDSAVLEPDNLLGQYRRHVWRWCISLVGDDDEQQDLLARAEKESYQSILDTTLPTSDDRYACIALKAQVFALQGDEHNAIGFLKTLTNENADVSYLIHARRRLRLLGQMQLNNPIIKNVDGWISQSIMAGSAASENKNVN